MIKIVLVFLCSYSVAFAYIPTVESLLRHSSNSEINSNGVALTFMVKKIEAGTKNSGNGDASLLADSKAEDFYKLFFTKINNDVMKVSQTRYANNSFSEGSLQEKIYYPNFSPYTIKGDSESSEKGVFQGVLRSIIFNDGTFLVNYLKSMGISVKLNNEIINREKVEYLAAYKQYLIAINKDRTIKKTETNPLRPEDPAAREKAERIMAEPMYVDQKQVKLSREDGNMAWLISANNFEAVVSYQEREIQKVKFKSQFGEFEILCKNYWLANGTHSVPRTMLIKDFKGETFQIEITNLRHYSEKEDDLIRRLKKWDALLKGKESLDPKPPFLL